MSKSKTVSKISPAMEEILEWSKGRPSWQSDALRRLVESGAVTEEGIGELVLACLAEAGALEGGETAPKMVGLTRRHIPTTSVSDSAVRITALEDVKHANALVPNQRLGLSADGLNIIYGDNGSGKTGYSRIFKHAGRARRCDSKIRSNVFSPDPEESASASIHCEIGSTSTKVEWEDGQRPDELASVSCFDSDCAAVQVNQANTIDFTPFGLDLFGKLVEVSKRVKVRIDSRIETVRNSQDPLVAVPKVRPETPVGRALKQLSSKSNPSKMAEFCHLDEKQVARIEEVKTLLNSDPASKAKALRAEANATTRLLDKLVVIRTNLNAEALAKYSETKLAATTKRTAAEMTAASLAGDTPLGGIGTEPWMELWNAARKYSQQAAPEHEFPSTSDEDVCVLCQQNLEADAQLRLKNFDEFVRDESEREANKAQVALDAATAKITGLGLDAEEWKEALSDLIVENKTLVDNLLALVASAKETVDFLLEGQVADTPLFDQINFEAIGKLADLVEQWKKQEEALRASVRPEERAELTKELHDLEDRQWLQPNLDAFVDEIGRLDSLSKLEKAAKSTNSSAISRKGGELTTKYVTDELTERFAEEVKDLCGRDIKVSLGKGRSSKGFATYQITLDSTQDAKPNEVLSKGEFRCIAIAGFLTELATSENQSAIVLDDPVSSLGQEWRSHIATRLVKESATRQVIIFSHDMFFVSELSRIAKDCKVETMTSHVVRTPGGVGVCKPALPWLGAHTVARIKKLKSRLEAIQGDYENAEEAQRLEISQNFFSNLAETIERASEREFIGGCMTRFSNYIRVSRLWEMTVVDEADADVLLGIYHKCSNGKNSHDHSMSGRQTSAKLEDMMALLEELKDLLDSVHAKRKRIKDRRRGPRSSQNYETDF